MKKISKSLKEAKKGGIRECSVWDAGGLDTLGLPFLLPTYASYNNLAIQYKIHIDRISWTEEIGNLYQLPPPPPPPLQIKDGKMTRFGFCTALSSIWGDGACLLIYSPGGVLPVMAYTGGPRPKGVPFSGFRYMKG